MSEFMERLKSFAQKHKETQEDYIEKMKLKDLAYIDSTEGNIPKEGFDMLRRHLDWISERYREISIVDWFVDFCEEEIQSFDTTARDEG